MTPEAIISEIWKLPWHEVVVIAFKDDWILFCKMWWVFVPLIVSALIFAYLKKG